MPATQGYQDTRADATVVSRRRGTPVKSPTGRWGQPVGPRGDLGDPVFSSLCDSEGVQLERGLGHGRVAVGTSGDGLGYVGGKGGNS
jgi:hypothetical protein